MKFLDHKQIDIERYQWEAYKQLELLSDADRAALPPTPFTFGIDRIWRNLLRLLMDELVTEQQVEYLDRCWEADAKDRSPSKTLQRFLKLIS